MLVLTHRETNDHVVVNAGRRGTKRKADAVQEEEEKVAVELKESKEEVKDNDSGGRRVIIEHWWAPCGGVYFGFSDLMKLHTLINKLSLQYKP